jgi:hypothetical protein
MEWMRNVKIMESQEQEAGFALHCSQYAHDDILGSKVLGPLTGSPTRTFTTSKYWRKARGYKRQQTASFDNYSIIECLFMRWKHSLIYYTVPIIEVCAIYLIRLAVLPQHL